MSTINMLSWWQWATLLAIVPAIVLLYFLKLRRTPWQVPSTLLWHKTVEDLRANSLWQRLRGSILLALQILLVALVMLVLLRPGTSGAHLVGDRFVFLVDTSASMSATDVNPTRLDAAKQRIAGLIEQMADDDVAMIISFSDTARVEQVFTNNRRELERRLSAIEPTHRGTRLDDALRVAAAMAQVDRAVEAPDAEPAPATIYIASDGRFADAQRVAPAHLTPVFLPIGRKDPANLGITAFGVRRGENPSGRLQVFARLENLGPQTLAADVELYRDGVLFDDQRVQLDSQGSQGLVFELGDMPAGVFRLVARPGGALVLDDEAWAVVDPAVRVAVLLVTPGNEPLATALGTEQARRLADVEIVGPEVLASPGYQDDAAAGKYALVIYDRCQPRQMPRANTLFLGRAPAEASWQLGAKIAAPQIVDVETAHPLLHLIDLANVKFAEGAVVIPPPAGTTLVSTDAGPLFAIAPRDRFEDAVWGAELIGVDGGRSFANTDWPLRSSFPVFVLNLLGYLGDAATSGGQNARPGQPIALPGVAASGTTVVRTPSGKAILVEQAAGAGFDFTATDELGVYTVEAAGQPPRHFVVNLLDRSESEIDSRQEIQIGDEKIDGQAAWQGARRELWKPLLLGALGVLCLEWYIYNRRLSL